ncbi:hypothetical protein [uncultured Tateyamaria sp.]|uniref:hypothetical protein n=1 Tax=uncultured Tateyamaria sp. TaxID=455651 RepID=UPI00260FF053|nr:hypothetical protein [uncultured Tateyamaria sp.]
MTPRDLSRQSALVVGTNAVEIMDIEEYLTLSGWSTPVIAQAFDEAERILERADGAIHLVIVLLPQGHPDAAAIIRTCISLGIGLIVMNGARTKLVDGQVIMLTRPFVERDLDEALHALGLAVV